MTGSVYHINKGINQPLVFRGLKAHYIGYLAAGLVVLLLLFAGMYLAGANLLLCLGTILVLGSLLFAGTYHLSNTYGEHGLLKQVARRSIPACVRIRSRHAFTTLSAEHSIRKEGDHGTGN